MEFRLRFCGSVGYLGLVFSGEQELFRTGKHHPTPEEALEAIKRWFKMEAK